MKGQPNYELVDAVAEESDSDLDDDKGDTFDVREILRSSSSQEDAEHAKKKKMVSASYIRSIYVYTHIYIYTYIYEILAETQGGVGQNRTGLRIVKTETECAG